jgi:glycosyltransferase involved in cell wall biosynthesis
MERKFLLLSQVFYPDQVSTASLYTNLCSVIAEENIEVEVWAGHPSYTEQSRQPQNRKYNGINIQYLPSTNFKKKSLWGRLINTFTFTLSASIKIIFSGEKTPVWTHTTPPLLGIIISLICYLKKRKFIYILLDVFPEGIIRLGMVSEKNPIIKIWHFLFLKSLQRSSRVIVIGRDMQKWIEQECKEITGNIEYIPHWQDDKLISPVPFVNNSVVRAKKLENKFVVQYSGNFGLWNEVKTMGQVVAMDIPDVLFMFVGDGIRKEELLKELTKAVNENYILLPFQKNEDFNNYLTASHVQLVSLREGLEGMAVPSKIYGILAAGIPVIAMVPENSEIAYIVNEEECGIVIKPEDLEGLKNSILKLKSDTELRIKIGQNGRKAFDQKYSGRKIAGEYKRILYELYSAY